MKEYVGQSIVKTATEPTTHYFLVRCQIINKAISCWIGS